MHEEDLRFCAAVSVGALWPAGGPFSPAPINVRGEGEGRKRGRKKRDQDKEKSRGCR